MTYRRVPLIAAGCTATLVVGVFGPSAASARSVSPDETFSVKGDLYDTTSVGSDDAWAVGATPKRSHRLYAAIAAHWNGHGWKQYSLDTSAYSDLAGIAAVTSNDIWAVGQHRQDAKPAPLIEHWDGTAWHVVETANPPAKGSLEAVTANAADDAWAVGAAAKRGLIEHWNGTKWVQVKNPVNSSLAGVDASSSTDAWAVGSHYHSGYLSPVVEHFDGSGWQQDDSFIDPNPHGSTTVNGVAAIASDDVWVAGYSQGRQGGQETLLLEHWDGVSWSLVPGPAGHRIGYWAEDLTAVATDDIWVSGFRYYDKGFAAHWDGQAWSLVVAGHKFNQMSGLSSSSSSDVWAVSDSETYGHVAHWNGAHWAYR